MKLPGFNWRMVPEVAWRSLVFVIAVAIQIIVATRWNRWQGGVGWQTTDDAYVQSDLTPIAAKVPGYLTAMPVADFERVRAGQLIAQVYDGDYRATVAQAQANVAAAAAQVGALMAQSALQSANVEAAKAQVAA